MIKRYFAILIVSLGYCFSGFCLETQPVSDNLIILDSKEGGLLFSRSIHTSFWKLIPYFTTQNTLTYCGIASATMVLNASNIQAPITPSLAPYRMFNQENFFTPYVLSIVTPTQVGMRGVGLEELSNAIKTFHVDVKTVYGSETTEDNFRKDVISAIRSADHFVIINFHRKYLHEEGEGHFSPIAAYDEKTDRFLLLDVSRYKYPIVWVKTSELYQAMSLDAKGIPKKMRGYIIIADAR